MLHITDQDHDEIIAIQFGSDIYFGQSAVDKAIELQDLTAVHPRSTFKFMAELDLDPKWEEYSRYPTIFTITQYKEHCNKSTP